MKTKPVRNADEEVLAGAGQLSENRFEVPGFTIRKVLHDDGHKIICQASRRVDKQRVILKIIIAEFSDSVEVLNLRREYELAATLRLPGVVSMLDLVEFRQGWAIVMDDFGGIELTDYSRNVPLPVADFLEIAGQLTTALAALHQHGIIHKDLKPENMLINPETKVVRLIDFGIATLLSQETVSVVSHRELEGSLNYMSPEQTGRTNRLVDYRTDFYSLGVTFYQLATGQLPFFATDPVEMIHAHLARTPLLPSAVNPVLPEPLSALILKLMHKSPEGRYQSAGGLKADLVRCTTQWQRGETMQGFGLAADDYSDRFQIPQTLYGRDEEIKRLLDAFEHVNQGQSALLMVSGFSGIGKSSLIQEVHKPIVARRGYFISGKYDQFHRDAPYSALIDAFRSLVRQVVSESNEAVANWKTKLLAGLGANGRIITDVIPEVEWLIGPQPELIPLPPSESQNRFNLVFLQFVQTFARPEHPLVLFLDDLQWADVPSLKLLERLLADKQTTYLLVIGAYRDNEVGATHPLVKTLDHLHEEGYPVRTITLTSLPLEDITQLIADTLRCPLVDAQPLAELVLTKTGGNPFFVNEFLKTLHRHTLITFDHATGRWAWDVEQIRQQDITDNVVELMSRKINLLDPKARQLCQYAACIGNRFDLLTLATVNKKTLHETARDLWPAIHEGLILPIGTAYRLAEVSRTDEADTVVDYRFLHDRVQQAAYALNDEQATKALHLTIGRLLLNTFSADDQREHLFDLVNQFGFATDLIHDPDERIAIAQLNQTAGQRAKASAAYEPAFKYLSTGIRLLPADAWKHQYALALALHTEGAEAAYLSGAFAEMERLTDVVFSHSTDVLHRVQAYIIKIQAYVSLSKNEEALNTAFEALHQLGVTFPTHPNQLHIIVALLKTKWLLRGKSAETLFALPEMTDPRQAAVTEILSNAASPSYFARPNLFPLIAFRQISLSLRYGNHVHSAFAYSTYGLVMCGSTLEFAEGIKYGQLAIRLLERFNSGALYAKIHFVNATFIRHWTFHFGESLPELIDSYQKGLETGDFLFASYAAFNHGAIGFYMGKPLPQLKPDMDAYAAALRRIKQDLGLGWLNSYRQTVTNLMEPGLLNTKLSGPDYDEAVQKQQHEDGKDFSGLCVYHMNKMILNYLVGNTVEALQHGAASEKRMDSVLAGPHVSSIVYFYTLTLLRAAGELTVSQQTGNGSGYYRRQARKRLATIRKWAKNAPANHLAKQYLVEAELNRLQGHRNEALALYQKAAETARNNRFLQEEALANELAGRFLMATGDNEQSRAYVLEARRLYVKWGALAKVRELDEQYSLKVPSAVGEKPATTRENTYERLLRQGDSGLDMVSLMKASLAISGEIMLDRLLSQLMRVVIENAGAQKGYLLIERSGTWTIEAEGYVDADQAIKRSVPLAGNAFVPESVIQYVLRTREDLVIADIQHETRFVNDSLVRDKQARSVLCLPIINQGRLIGALYLENNLHTGVFTERRVQFLKLLSGQVAVSLENALLYENLEQKVEERTQEISRQKDEIEQEKQKSDILLLNILPAETADELKSYGSAKPRRFDSVTVMFTDFENFSRISEQLSADDLVTEINYYYSAFDQIMVDHGLEKIKTIGDSYMCAGGLPVGDAAHAINAVRAALAIQAFIEEVNQQRRQAGKLSFQCRIGLHSGPVIAGIVGIKKFAYDIWGDTVNIASRMESSGEVGKVNISDTTFQLVKETFTCRHRGKIVAKNKGEIDMYYVEGPMA